MKNQTPVIDMLVRMGRDLPEVAERDQAARVVRDGLAYYGMTLDTPADILLAAGVVLATDDHLSGAGLDTWSQPRCIVCGQLVALATMYHEATRTL